MNIIAIMIATAIISGFGMGGAYLIWVRTRPKKETWNADVYQVTNSMRKPIVDREGKIVSDLKLQDLKPYATDVVEKFEEHDGRTIFRLQKLNIATGPVTSDVVEYWGDKKRKVTIVLVDNQAFFLQKGYDSKSASMVVNPMPISRQNMIQSNIIIKKKRLHKNKDVLEAITPWVMLGVAVIGLVFVSYIIIQGLIDIGDTVADAQKYTADRLIELEEMRQGVRPIVQNPGRQSSNAKIPSTTADIEGK